VAARFNRKLTLGNQVRLEPLKQQTDRFGRRLAHVFTKDDLLVGEALLLEGLATSFLFEPHPHEKRFLKAQRRAMNAQKGRWRQWQEPFPKQTYVGNRRSMRFHRIDCNRAKFISPKNRVRYKTMWDAYYDGYAPARGCLP
jgi:micrococcal nuclease